MKKILSLLMCYVFLQTQTFAGRGGPQGGKGVFMSGAYSALMFQASPVGSGVGLLLVGAPNVGPATGDMLLFDFDSGEVITAAMNGLNNIKTGKLVCIVSRSGFGATGGTLISWRNSRA